MAIGEVDAARHVRIAADRQLSPVMEAMVVRAERDQICRVGRAVFLPVHDVVDLEMVRLLTSGNRAALIAQDHQPAGPFRDDALAPTDGDRDAAVDERWRQQTLTGDVPADRVREGPSERVTRHTIGSKVNADPESITSAGVGNAIQRSMRDLTQCVDVVDVDLAALEQRIASLTHR